jgi:general stress protein YciG
MAQRDEEKKDMTVREAGHKGGERTAETHGHEFYEEIGRKGGEHTAETHGHEFYEEIGKKGGEIGGPKGGQKVHDLIEEAKRARDEK